MKPADELRKAARTLFEVAPEITGRLAGLADPVATWLMDAVVLHLRDSECPYCNARNVLDIPCPALAVARAVNGQRGEG